MSGQQLQALSGLIELWPLWLVCAVAIIIVWIIETGVFDRDNHFHLR